MHRVGGGGFPESRKPPPPPPPPQIRPCTQSDLLLNLWEAFALPVHCLNNIAFTTTAEQAKAKQYAKCCSQKMGEMDRSKRKTLGGRK